MAVSQDFQAQLDAISTRLADAQSATDAAKAEADAAVANATDAESKAQAALDATAAQAQANAATDQKAQTGLDEIAALVATLKGSGVPVPKEPVGVAARGKAKASSRGKK